MSRMISNVPRWISTLAVSGALTLAAPMVGCGDTELAITCEDLLPPKDATFGKVFELVGTPGGAKSCAGCHNTRTPVWGYNFEGPGVAYDALTTKTANIYAQVASGEMPDTNNADTKWNADDLRLLRSWYCHGAFYE